MRKRDALLKALGIEVPKMTESYKLLFVGVISLTLSLCFSVLLTVFTANLNWTLLLPIGVAILIWFTRASIIMEKEEVRK